MSVKWKAAQYFANVGEFELCVDTINFRNWYWYVHDETGHVLEDGFTSSVAASMEAAVTAAKRLLTEAK